MKTREEREVELLKLLCQRDGFIEIRQLYLGACKQPEWRPRTVSTGIGMIEAILNAEYSPSKTS